jgi:PBP1b-binding outer membrane lipoprotein LpoB
MKKFLTLAGLSALIPLFVAGCASEAKYIETGGRQSIVNVDQINIQDFMQAADAMIQSLLASGSLDNVANPPALIAVSRVENRTGQQLEMPLLTKKITIALNKSGKAITRLNFGVGPDGRPLVEDPSGKGIADENAFRNDVKTERLPDFTLSGRIIQTRATAGSLKQNTFSFQLSLARGNDAVWEDEKEITKQGRGQGSVGF